MEKKKCRICKGDEWVNVDGGAVACPVCVPRPPPMRRAWYWPLKKQEVVMVEEVRPTKFWNDIKERTLWRKSPKKFLIEMTFSNGNVGYMVVRPKDRIWRYKGESYVVVEAAAKWCGTEKKALLRYVEGYALPVDFSPDAVKHRDTAAAKAPDIKASFEPSVLREVLRFEYVKAMLRSMSGGLILIMLIVVIVNFIVAAVHLYLSGKHGKWW